MGDIYKGVEHTGNFTLSESIDSVNGYKLLKLEGSLYLVKDEKFIRLNPLDEQASQISLLFSDLPNVENESIYSLYYNSDVLTVVLNTFSKVVNLKFQNKKFLIHLRRPEEKRFCLEGILKIKREEDIVPSLSKEFIENESIFVEKSSSGYFVIYGRDHSAKLSMERPGIYVIDEFRRYRKYDKPNLIQIYKNIRFIVSNDAAKEKGNDIDYKLSVGGKEIFDVWSNYMEFLNFKYEMDMKNSIIGYSDVHIRPDYITFDLSCKLHDLVNVSDVSWEFISSFNINDKKIDLKKSEDIIKIKNEKSRLPIYVGRAIRESSNVLHLKFKYPDVYVSEELEGHSGVIYPSDKLLQITRKRRNIIDSVIESRSNASSELILRMTDKDVKDNQLPTHNEAITWNMLQKMFGSKDVKLQEEYVRALNIALNTPDIALIQGPPGTGKTTLIKGLVARLKELNKDVKILVGSEQHEAVNTIVDRLSESEVLPPFVTSHKNTSDNEEINRNFVNVTTKYRDRIQDCCNQFLNDGGNSNPFTQSFEKYTILMTEIKFKNYDVETVKNSIPELKEVLSGLLPVELAIHENRNLDDIINGNGLVDSPNISDSFLGVFFEKLELQNSVFDDYSDESILKIMQLQNFLKRNEHKELTLDREFLCRITSGDTNVMKESMPQYKAYIESLHGYINKSANPENQENLKNTIERMDAVVQSYVHNRKLDINSVIDKFRFLTQDISTVSKLVEKYTDIYGSTCAQSNHSVVYSQVLNNTYDYVIIDEAARVNPMDLMMPIMNGIKVVLVGDHMQLPHYLETKEAKEFQASTDYAGVKPELLKKSLFQLIYENLEEANLDNRLSFPRTSLLNEQYRMNPVIGDFISENFYDRKIRNSASTYSNINDYGVFGGKNVVCINVKNSCGEESKIGSSHCRKAEIMIIRSLVGHIRKLHTCGSDEKKRKLNIGVISFYKGQVNLINEWLKTESDACRGEVVCNTVDSYQGKEFDIVLVSCVRSNKNGGNRIGFLKDESNRINVALSRAKRLLVLIGDLETIRDNPYLDSFIRYTEKNGVIKEVSHIGN